MAEIKNTITYIATPYGNIDVDKLYDDIRKGEVSAEDIVYYISILINQVIALQEEVTDTNRLRDKLRSIHKYTMDIS